MDQSKSMRVTRHDLEEIVAWSIDMLQEVIAEETPDKQKLRVIHRYLMAAVISRRDGHDFLMGASFGEVLEMVEQHGSAHGFLPFDFDISGLLDAPESTP